MSRIPSSSTFITALLSQLDSNLNLPALATANPLQGSITKNLILTLHCIFPHDFLPALDLLDRRFVKRFIIDRRLTAFDEERQDSEIIGRPRDDIVYYVRSAQQPRTSRYHSAAIDGIGTNYEVRLGSWNCSCPAFAFSAFNGSLGTLVEEKLDNGGEDREGKEEWRFGGLMLDQLEVPMCKHLLACVLVERCNGLATCLEECMVGKEEAAGWAAGWGG